MSSNLSFDLMMDYHIVNTVLIVRNKMYHNLLKEFIAFKSISTDPAFKSEMMACADRLVALFGDHGFTTQRLEWYGNPVVFAHYQVSEELPTMLIYGHYDVQPAEQNDGWQSDPFVLTQRDWRLYARGVVDNKWQVLIHIATVLELIVSWNLAYNIKFLIEGDEETGGGDMQKALSDHRDLFACDVALISDGEIIGNHTPTIVAWFRGGMNATIILTTALSDTHSGIYGNILPSASHEASRLIAKLYDHDNRIAIPGWYDDLTPISDGIIANNQKISYDLDELEESLGIKQLLKNWDFDPATAVGLLPTIQVSGVQSWYTGNGYKNIIPAKAVIKLNFRFWPWQNSQLKQRQFEEFLQTSFPDYVSRTFETSDPYDAISIDTSSEISQEVEKILNEIYGKKALLRYAGGAVPISWLLREILWADVVVADLGNEDCNMHGIDENFDETCIHKWLEFSKKLLQK